MSKGKEIQKKLNYSLRKTKKFEVSSSEAKEAQRPQRKISYFQIAMFFSMFSVTLCAPI